nr:MAG TPA: hypothetical protein [Caudoviricetes sp.]
MPNTSYCMESSTLKGSTIAWLRIFWRVAISARRV